VLYGSAGLFPRPTRKARLGLRLSAVEISEQCDALNSWLRETVGACADLPLASQSEVRRFFGFEGAAPPAWTTAKSATGVGGLFQAALRDRAERNKKPNAVYPLGDSASLPGVTRRGRLECRDKATGAWVSTHVILTHLSLLVFQPLEDGPAGRRPGSPSAAPTGPIAFVKAVVAQNTAAAAKEPEGAPPTSPTSAAAALVGTAARADAHPAAAAVEMELGGKDAAHSSGRLLHNVHVTDVLSILRHGDADSFAPPIHHRCFTIGDLNDASVCLRAPNARDCLGWLKALARAKDRALAAVHRLDDKAHGHDLVLATLNEAGGDERIVARGSPRFASRHRGVVRASPLFKKKNMLGTGGRSRSASRWTSRRRCGSS